MMYDNNIIEWSCKFNPIYASLQDMFFIYEYVNEQLIVFVLGTIYNNYSYRLNDNGNKVICFIVSMKH